MENKTYSLQEFNVNLVRRGHLCAVTSYNYSKDSITSDDPSLKLICIPTVVSNTEFSVVVDNEAVIFSSWGYQKDGEKKYRMYLASSSKGIQFYGNAIKRAMKVTTTRTFDGVITKVEDYKPVKGEDEAEMNVLVSNLNARDNFAIQALKCIIPTVSDLKNMGDDERDYYCKLAYQWAASMMDNAAQARATFIDETHSTEQSTDITELETNQEKILNNILFTMERTQQVIIDGGNQITSDRIVNPSLNSKIDNLESTIKEQTSILDKALGSLITAISNQTMMFKQIVEAIKDLRLTQNQEIDPTDNTKEK